MQQTEFLEPKRLSLVRSDLASVTKTREHTNERLNRVLEGLFRASRQECHSPGAWCSRCESILLMLITYSPRSLHDHKVTFPRAAGQTYVYK